ncbi:MAG: prolyl oligopeptidase family serine peptidase, partial [Bacteroidota bacterium]
VFFFLFSGYSHLYSQSIHYPVTKKVDQVDDYFGVKVEDPYRWLEDDNSEETKAWVNAQNEVTENYLEKIPYKEKIKQRLTELMDYERYSRAYKKGDYYYFYKNDGLQKQNIVYRQKGMDNITEEVFIDPNIFSDDNTIRLRGLYFSIDNKYCSYSVSNKGSDWLEFYIINTDTKEKLEDHIKWVKFSGMSWHKDGFFYSGYDKPLEDEKMKGINENQKIFYHKLGTKQSEDKLIYQDTENPKITFTPIATDNEKYLIISSFKGYSNEIYYYKDLKNNSEIKPLVSSHADHGLVASTDEGFFIRTSHNAPHYKLVLIDPKNPSEDKWKTVIPEQESIMQGVTFVGGNFIAKFQKGTLMFVSVYDYNGKKLYDVELPGAGTVTGFTGRNWDKEVFYTYTSFAQPPTIYKYDIINNKSTLFKKSNIKIDINNFKSEIIYYPSKDGTKIPLYITYKKGIELNSNNPTYLYGYGGFGARIGPHFSIHTIPLLEQGFLICMPGLRGGGEYGEEWHKAGMLENKQNVFDDFIYAAKYLFENGYTSPDKIGISGTSNGGLLVGACMTQKPEMFKVALPFMGIYDMLRYQKFTIGHAWITEFGSSDNKDQFGYLYKYSPLHNVEMDVKYPATLIATADHDDRSLPAHSYKFAATLQEKIEGDNPILISIEKDAGHGGGTLNNIMDGLTDSWSFLMYNLGVEYKE